MKKIILLTLILLLSTSITWAKQKDGWDPKTGRWNDYPYSSRYYNLKKVETIEGTITKIDLLSAYAGYLPVVIELTTSVEATASTEAIATTEASSASQEAASWREEKTVVFLAPQWYLFSKRFFMREGQKAKVVGSVREIKNKGKSIYARSITIGRWTLWLRYRSGTPIWNLRR